MCNIFIFYTYIIIMNIERKRCILNMQKLIWNPGYGYFNHNIEMLRDISETIGLDCMVNAYGNLSWGLTEGNRIVIMIENKHNNGNDAKYVCVEYQGDGVCTIEDTDAYGKPIDDNHNIDKLFDTHAYYCGKSSRDAFHKRLKDKFDITI